MNDLRIEVSAEDIQNSGSGPFCCPIARAVTRAGGSHGGICRAICVIRGISYEPAADAIAFMDQFDLAYGVKLLQPAPTTVTFVRPTPKAAVQTYL